MQPGGFRCCSACLKARHVTNWQLPRLRLYTRPSRAEQGRRPGVARPGRRASGLSQRGTEAFNLAIFRGAHCEDGQMTHNLCFTDT
jgi:hypothetical protein